MTGKCLYKPDISHYPDEYQWALMYWHPNGWFYLPKFHTDLIVRSPNQWRIHGAQCYLTRREAQVAKRLRLEYERTEKKTFAHIYIKKVYIRSTRKPIGFSRWDEWWVT